MAFVLPYLFLVSPSYRTLGGLCFVILTLPGYVTYILLLKYRNAVIAIAHVCFIPLTFAGSFGRYLNTRTVGLCFYKHFPWEPADVHA